MSGEASRVVDFLLPILRQEGLASVKRFTRKGAPFRVRVSGRSFLAEPGAPDDSGLDELADGIELYENDAYPNDRGEVFLHTWSAIGSSCKRPDLAAAISKSGTPARVTTKNKYWGLAVKLEAAS